MRLETSTPKLVSVIALDGRDEAALLALASAAPALDARLAAAIRESVRGRDVKVSAGRQTVTVGTPARFTELGIAVDRFGDWPERLRLQQQEILFVAVDGRTAGLLGLADAEPALFPTDIAGLPSAVTSHVVELGDGDEFNLRVAPVTKRLGDATIRMLAYNGSIPGPTLRVRQGSALVVGVTNDGDLETTVHWHGLRLDNRFDGTASTQQPIPLGGRFTYRLTFPDPGVYWYHPHIREDYTQEAGLYGTIIVTPSDPAYWPEVDREVSITLDDVLVEDGKIAPFSRQYPTYTAMGRFGNVFLLNGESGLSLAARVGEVVRLYLTNTANTRVFHVAIPGAHLKLVGGDSGRYEHETSVDTVLVAPSERAVVDVLFPQAGELTIEHRTPKGRYPLGTIVVAADRLEPSLASGFANLRTNADLAGDRARLADYLAAQPDRILALVAEMDMGEPDAQRSSSMAFACPMHPEVRSDRPGRCPHCGMKLIPADLVGDRAVIDPHDHPNEGHDDQLSRIEWEDDMVDVNRITSPINTRWKLVDRDTGKAGAAIDWQFRVGDRVKIRLVNETDSDHPMPHPFHVHGAGRFLILSRDGIVEPNLVRKDTVLVHTGETVDILLEVSNPGTWMAHCHIAEHHESGMLLRFRVDL